MAYSDEQRPEAQFGNQSRNSLNIQQPGETDSYDVFFSDPNRWKDNSTSFSLGDVLPTMGKGVAQSVRGTGEMARGLGDAMIQSPVKTGVRILNEFSRMGLPGVATVQDIFVGGSKGADEVIDTLPDGKNAVTDTVGKGLKVTGKAVSGGAKASDEWLTGKMSPGAQRALNTPMTEGYDDSAVWVAKGVNLIGALVPDMVAGGVTKKLGDVTLRKVLTAGLEKKYIAAGMQPERATALAAEAVDKKMPDFFQAGLITHSTVSAQGRSAMAAADAVLNADYSELAKSPKFQQTFLSIDADPQHAQLTDRQKMDLAKERVADEVRAQLATDPELLAVNAMAAKLGDAQLLNLAMRGTAKTVKSGIVRNATEQGTINAAQGGYLVNIRKADDHGQPDTYAYPTNAELDGGIREAFDHLFRTLKTRETDKGVAFYSRKGVTRTPEGNLISDVNRSAEAKGSPVPQVEAVARGVISGIKDSDLKVRVVKSQKEAEALAGESFDGYGKVHAFYRPDKREIVLVADNIPDGRTVREKLRHEIIHHAMEHVVTPAEYQTIIKTVLKTRDSDNATIREAWRKVDASYGKESPEVQAGEFLAHMAEKQPIKFVAAWERVVALVKGVLRRTGLLKPTELNDIRLVRETIRTLGQRVREGYTPREDGADASSQYSRSGKPDPFKVPEDEGERYRDDLARMMKSLRTTDLTVNIGRTPPVLRHLGAPDLPLVISRDTVRKATNGVKHVVPMDVIERLPELMHDPDAIYRSATERNAVVMLLDAMDKNGDPVVSAVHMKAVRSRLEINKVASVYGTEGGMNKANSLDKAGLTLYRKKKLSRDNLLHRGLQLPKGEHSYRGSVDKILYPEDIRKGPYYSRTSSLTPEETIASRFVRQMQDKFQVLKAVQENIRKTGGKIDDSNNAYMAEELFHGKAENDLNVMKERYVQPLAKLLADYKIAQADLDEYLYARHAPERNAHIAKINPKMPDGGSGMTNAEAAEIMQRVRNSGKQAQYDRLAGIIDDMLARRREIIREAGLEESGVVDAWQKAYRYYVPLKGQDVDGVVSLPRTGKGFTIGGRESKQAMGRASRAQSPSTQAIQDLSESLIRNRKNEVGNAFLKLVQDNPDKDYWQVFTDDRPDTMRVIAERKDQETGETIREVVERPVPMAMMADRYFTTKKDGKTYYIKLHDPRLMRAMKNMGPETSNAVIRTLGKVNRFLATVNTSYNPEFLVSNFIRDVQTAVMNLKAEQGRSDGKLKGLDNLSALAVVKDSRSAMSAVYASLRGKTLTGKGAQWQKVWKEFVEDGGKTGWFNMGDLEGQQKEMDRLVSLAKGGWKGQSIGAWHSFLNLVEDANGAVENALRLSAYKHARDAGLSRQQAASLAKNMTVNFNRRGEQGMLMNSLYMFANASIQGTANLVRTLGHLNGDGPLLERLRWKNLNVPQKIVLAAVGAGYLLGSLNRSVAGEDDDGVNWYDKVPSHVKERNLVIMKSMFGGKAGEYWSIPLPYGYNVFFLLGHTAEGVAAGDLTASRAAGNVVGGILGAFSPIGSETSETLSGALLKNAAPTILRPFANLAMNENFMGAQIYQENMPFGTPKPDSQLGRRSTPEAYKAFASWLNAFSGGSQYRPGAVDITPESLKFWIDYISGGTGRFISKTTDAAVKSLNGIDIPEQQVPFLGKISGEVMPYADQQKMYDRMTEVAQYHAELKSLTGAERTAFIDENNGKLLMNGLMQDTRKRLKDLRKQRDAIYADSSLSLAQQAAMVKSVERDMKVAVDRFNREYNKKVGVD
ncbi:LPD38 domain-containing protein [Escherichia coli]